MRLSIVTPSFNQAEFIERTVKSVLDQNYPDLEYWVMDGGSTDGTLDILRRYEGRLHWVSEKDHGQSDAINKGWARCTGEVIAWNNSDDTYEPGSFDAVMKVFQENPDVDFVIGDGQVIDEADRVLRRYRCGPFNARNLIRMGVSYVFSQAAFFRRSLLQDVGGLDLTLHYAMDYDLWCRIGPVAKTVYLPQVLGNFRVQSESKTWTNRRPMLEESRRVRQRYMRGIWDQPWSWYFDARVGLYCALEPLLLRRKRPQPHAG